MSICVQLGNNMEFLFGICSRKTAFVGQWESAEMLLLSLQSNFPLQQKFGCQKNFNIDHSI